MSEVNDQQRNPQADERHMRQLFDEAPVGYHELNNEGVITRVNRTELEMLGYEAQEMLGRHPWDFVLEKDQFRNAFEAKINGTIPSGQGFERTCVRKDGSRLPVLIRDRLLTDGEDRIVGMCSVMQDITERKQLEEQLRQSQKMEAIGQLAGGVAHDFNNILTGISGYVSLLLDEFEPGSRACEDVEKIGRLADRAATLTQQLLAFSRRQALQPTVLDLNELIEEVTQMLSSAMGEDVEVLTNYAPDLGNVHADPAQITQVLMNLALNARDAMPEGGVLTIETENVELDRNYAAAHRGVTPGPYVMTAISDNGCGMDTATQERIFDPFFTTKPTGRGSGLGLPTAYGIVKQHGGNIWVYSEPGEGSTFKFYLPRTESRVRRRSEESGRDTAAGGEESILLVEDEESVRKLATRVLERKGYSIVSAATPKEAENLFHRHGGDFALLLTDVVLPGRSGGELYDRLRTSASTLKVLYMSGYTDSVVVQRGKISEDAPFLRKPFSADELAQKVRDLLDE